VIRAEIWLQEQQPRHDPEDQDNGQQEVRQMAEKLILLGQNGGEEDHGCQLGELRGLDRERADLDPSPGSSANIAEHERGHEARNCNDEDGDGELSVQAIRDLREHDECGETQPDPDDLALDVEEMVAGLSNRDDGRGREHRPEANDEQHDDRHNQEHRPTVAQMEVSCDLPTLDLLPNRHSWIGVFHDHWRRRGFGHARSMVERCRPSRHFAASTPATSSAKRSPRMA